MNVNDRQLIADVLCGIATGDYNNQVNSGTKLIKMHPGIARLMDKESLRWWELEHLMDEAKEN